MAALSIVPQSFDYISNLTEAIDFQKSWKLIKLIVLEEFNPQIMIFSFI